MLLIVIHITSLISTHTPLAGRDHFPLCAYLRQDGFLLTRPLRDVTATGFEADHTYQISTHTPLAGRDVHC